MRIQQIAATAAFVVSVAALVPASPAYGGRSLVPKAPAAPVLSSGSDDGLGADLAVTLAVSPWDPEVSSELVHTITVSNQGRTGGSPAVVRSQLAEYLEWLAGDDACLVAEDVVLCSVAPLAAGETRQLQFTLEVLESYPQETVREVHLTPSDPDPAPQNNFAQVRTVLDVESPRVEAVRAQLGDSGRKLRGCTQVASAPTGFEVVFSESVKVGQISRFADAASSFRLVRPGADGTYENLACAAAPGAVPPGDVEVKILGVAWHEEILTAELELDSSLPQSDASGHWRLVVCGDLTDQVGNPLDGNQDGEGGDDAIVDFRVDEGNLIDNGHFDCNVDHWIAVGAEADAFVLGEDSEQDTLSRGASLEPPVGVSTVGAGQCVVEPGPGSYEISLLHRLAATADVSSLEPVAGVWAGVACTLYESTTCDGLTELVGREVSASVPVPDDGTWGKLLARLEIPEGTGSVLCTVAASGESEALTFEFDRVRFAPALVEADRRED